MEKRRTIYIVTHGSHSDYGIVAVYLDEAEAERFVEKYKEYDYGIEEYEEGPQADQWHCWELRIDMETGDIRDSEKRSPIISSKLYEALDMVGVNIYLENRGDCKLGKPYIKAYLEVRGESEEKAIKRAGDARKAILALGLRTVLASARYGRTYSVGNTPLCKCILFGEEV